MAIAVAPSPDRDDNGPDRRLERLAAVGVVIVLALFAVWLVLHFI